jgi:acyl dehydratase
VPNNHKSPRFFEDFVPGDAFQSDGITLTESAIIDFGLMYDPQPFHVDVTSSEAAVQGGVIASGLQTFALAFRLFFMERVHSGASLGGWGVDDLRWTSPVKAGETLRCKFTVVESRPSTNKLDRGTVRFRFEGFVGDRLTITFVANLLLRRRELSQTITL